VTNVAEKIKKQKDTTFGRAFFVCSLTNTKGFYCKKPLTFGVLVLYFWYNLYNFSYQMAK